MSSVLALEVDSRLRRRLRVGVRAGAAHGLVDRVRFASSWQDLLDLALLHPDSPAFVDPSYPSEDGGVDPVASLHRKVPACPLISYGRPAATRPRSVVANSEFVARLTPGVDDNFATIASTVLETADHGAVRTLVADLMKAAPARAAGELLEHVVQDTVFPCTVRTLAANLRTSAPMLRRRCRAWGLPRPKKLVSLAHIYHVHRLIRWSGCSPRAVALALGYSAYSNYSRSVRREVECTSSKVMLRGGAAYVAERLVAAVRGTS